MKIELRIHGKDGERTVEVASFPAVLGRHADCAIRIDDPRASRRHGTIEVREGRPWVVDLGSRNGILSAGARISEQPLEEGQELRIGATVIRVAAIAVDPPAGTEGVPATGGEEDAPPAPRSEVLERLRASRRGLPLGYRIGIGLFILLAAGAVAYHVATREEPPPPPDRAPDRTAEAEAKRLELERTIGLAGTVRPDLIAPRRSATATPSSIPWGGTPSPTSPWPSDRAARWRSRTGSSSSTAASGTSSMRAASPRPGRSSTARRDRS